MCKCKKNFESIVSCVHDPLVQAATRMLMESMAHDPLNDMDPFGVLSAPRKDPASLTATQALEHLEDVVANSCDCDYDLERGYAAIERLRRLISRK